MKNQCAWVTARFIECRAADSAGQKVEVLQKLQEYEQTIKQEKHHWGVIRVNDAQLDLNKPGVKVV